MTNTELQLSDQLARLETEKLLRLEQPAPKWEYVFRNVIAQEVIYEGLLLTQRKQLHAVVGEALENKDLDQVEQLAFHYRRGERWDKALHYLKIASQRARREHANNAAIGHYTEILNCLSHLNDKEQGQHVISAEYWDVLLERVRLYNLIGWRDEELEDLGTLGIMAEALDDNRRRALAAQQWAYLYETSGDYDSGIELMERFVTLAQHLEDEQLLGHGYSHLGRLLYLRGQYEKAAHYLQQALHVAETYNNDQAMAECFDNQGRVAYYQADYDQAMDAFIKAISLWRTIGDQAGLGGSLAHLGQVYYDLGQYMSARECYQQSLALHRAIGDRAGEAQAKRGLGRVLRSLGDYPNARRYFEEALTFYLSIGDRYQEAECMYDLGFLHCRQGERPTALIFLEESMTLLRELSAPWWMMVRALIYYSWTLCEQGQFAEAKTYITEAMEIERDTQQKVSLVEDVMVLGWAALGLNEVSLALTCAEQVLHFVKHQGIKGIEHPGMVYLICHKIMQAGQRPERAMLILAWGRDYVVSHAKRIDDPKLAAAYLNNVSENRKIQELVQTPSAAEMPSL